MSLFTRIKNLLNKKTIVLMYHRIASVEYDPWRLCVTQENFEEQVALLKRLYNVVSVAEVINELREGRIIENSVSITFDDGYADNFLLAKPVLEKYSCPATFFIATQFTGSENLFWWDLLEEIILVSPVLPAELNLVLKNGSFTYSLKDTELSSPQISLQQKWEWPGEVPNDRCRLYLLLWEQLLPLSIPEIMQVMDQLISWSNFKQSTPAGKAPMTLNQLKLLTSNKLFKLGLHTHSHPALPFHDEGIQRNEMMECKSQLERNFSNNLNAIAFPYGRYNESTINAMKETGIPAGFTTAGKSIKKTSDILTLGRMQVANWGKDDFERILKNWFNYS